MKNFSFQQGNRLCGGFEKKNQAQGRCGWSDAWSFGSRQLCFILMRQREEMGRKGWRHVTDFKTGGEGSTNYTFCCSFFTFLGIISTKRHASHLFFSVKSERIFLQNSEFLNLRVGTPSYDWDCRADRIAGFSDCVSSKVSAPRAPGCTRGTKIWISCFTFKDSWEKITNLPNFYSPNNLCLLPVSELSDMRKFFCLLHFGDSVC